MTSMTANKIGFVYPGQGSQGVGMGADLMDQYAEARKRFEQADEFLKFSIKDYCQEGPADTLNQDLNAQLGIYITSIIITDILARNAIKPAVCTGYSSGFYAAAYAAGCFDFQNGLSIVKKAGELLLEVGKTIDGGMAVIFGLPLEQIQSISQTIGDVDIAIHNTARQFIISGLKPSVAKVMDAAMIAGALDTAWLPVATAYHSRFMKDASLSFLGALNKIELLPPKIPLYSYSTTQQINSRDDLESCMAMQLSHSVLWVDLIHQLSHNQVANLVEIGPGTMLSRSIRWIDRRIQMLDTSTVKRVQKVIQRLSPRPNSYER